MVEIIIVIVVKNFSLSSIPLPAVTSLVDTTCESPKKSDESQQKLCNSPRNNTNSQSVKRDSPPPSTTSPITLIDDVKKLEIRTSDPKINSPLASSSNLSKPDATSENLRLSSNNESNSRKSELKWQCSVNFLLR